MRLFLMQSCLKIQYLQYKSLEARSIQIIAAQVCLKFSLNDKNQILNLSRTFFLLWHGYREIPGHRINKWAQGWSEKKKKKLKFTKWTNEKSYDYAIPGVKIRVGTTERCWGQNWGKGQHNISRVRLCTSSPSSSVKHRCTEEFSSHFQTRMHFFISEPSNLAGRFGSSVIHSFSPPPARKVPHVSTQREYMKH